MVYRYMICALLQTDTKCRCRSRFPGECYQGLQSQSNFCLLTAFPHCQFTGMYMISENAVRLSVKEGAKIFSEEPVPRQARDALEKGIKLAEAGIKLAKTHGLTTAPELMGSLLCARAQGLTLKARFEEALACADEAVLIYRDLGCGLDHS